MPGRLPRSLPGARARTSAYAGCYGDDLNARRYSPEGARPIAESALEQLRLADWSIRIDDARAGGNGTCTTHVMDPQAKEVVIFPLEMSSPPEDAPFRLLAASVQAQIDGECLTRAEAVETVRPIAAELDINESAGELIILRPGLARDMQPHGRQRRWTDLGDSLRCLSAHRQSPLPANREAPSALHCWVDLRSR